jgi:Amt family ammonium transporter
VFATSAVNSLGKGWIYDGNFGQIITQIEGVLYTFIYTAIVTFIILKIVDVTVGLRVKRDVEVEGLDINLHGETVHS